MTRIRVLIADDHPVVLEGLRLSIAAQSEMEVVGVASNGQDALALTRQLLPEVVLLDLNMPEMSGFEATRLICEECQQVKVVAFSMHDKEVYIHRIFKAGASGYVLKGAPIEEIIRAIQEVRAGRYYLSAKVQGDVLKSFLRNRAQDPVEEGYDLLSEREQQVFRLIVEGNSTSQIGDLLCVSPKTIEKHRINIMRKLEVSHLIDMVKYAVRIGIIDPDIWKD